MRLASLLGIVCTACGATPPAPRIEPPIRPRPPEPAPPPVAPSKAPEVLEVARIASCFSESFAMDDNAVYVSCDNGAVYETTFGSAPRPIAKGSPYTSHAIAIDATRLFFMSSTSELSFVPRGGGAPTVFLKGYHILALQLHGQDLVAPVYNHGYARIPLGGGAPQIVSSHADRTFTVVNQTVYFAQYVGKEQHVFELPFAGTPATDLGKVPWIVEQIAAVGDTLFDGSELDLASRTRQPLPHECLAFATDGTFVYAGCVGGGLIAKHVTAKSWKPVADVLIKDGLALSRTRACWPDLDYANVTRVRCVARPNDLR